MKLIFLFGFWVDPAYVTHMIPVNDKKYCRLHFLSAEEMVIPQGCNYVAAAINASQSKD